MNTTIMAMSVIALLLIITPVVLAVRMNRMEDRVRALEDFVKKHGKSKEV